MAALATFALVAVLGWLVGRPSETAPAGRADPRHDPHGHVVEARSAEVRARFEQAVVMLHARQYEHAVAALHRVLELAPRMPEAHVNMGFALIGLRQAAAARDFFQGAIALRPGQANAYYGLAMTAETLGDMPAALGAMRTFVHLADASDPYVRKAQAALWEWESKAAAAAPPVPH